MRHRRPRPPRRGAARAAPSPWLGAALVVLLAVACSGPAIDPRRAPALGETRTFEGTLVFLLLGTPWLLLVVG